MSARAGFGVISCWTAWGDTILSVCDRWCGARNRWTGWKIPPGPPRGGCSATRPPPANQGPPPPSGPKSSALSYPCHHRHHHPAVQPRRAERRRSCEGRCASHRGTCSDDGTLPSPLSPAMQSHAGRSSQRPRPGGQRGPQRVDDDSSQRRRAQAPAPAPTLDALPNITSRPRSRVLVYTLSLPRAVPSLLPRTMFRQLPPGRLTTQRSSL